MSAIPLPALPSPVSSLEGYLRLVNSLPVLDADEERALAERWRRDRDLDAARALVASHLRYVVRISRQYRGYGLPQEDLIQEGNVGLMKAVRRYDPARGVRLLGYAVHWIRAAIHEFILRNWRIVRLATTKARRRLFYKLRSAKRQLERLTQKEAAAIAHELCVAAADVVDMDARLYSPDVPFDEPTDDAADGAALRPAAWLADERAGPDAIVARDELRAIAQTAVRNALERLNDRARFVLEHRWLVGEDERMTLQRLGEALGVSAERARQIEQQALRKLRAELPADLELAFASG